MHGRYTPESSRVQNNSIILKYVVSSSIHECYRCLLLLFLRFGISVAKYVLIDFVFCALIFIYIYNKVVINFILSYVCKWICKFLI